MVPCGTLCVETYLSELTIKSGLEKNREKIGNVYYSFNLQQVLSSYLCPWHISLLKR